MLDCPPEIKNDDDDLVLDFVCHRPHDGQVVKYGLSMLIFIFSFALTSSFNLISILLWILLQMSCRTACIVYLASLRLHQ